MMMAPVTDFAGFIDKMSEFVGNIAQFVMTFALVLMIIVVVLLVYRLFNYVLRSAALARIGRRRHIKAWGLAWVPLLYTYVLGAIADDHDKKNTGVRTGLRVFLPVMTFTAILLKALSIWISNAPIRETAQAAKNGLEQAVETVHAYLSAVNTNVLPLCLILSAVSACMVLILIVYKYICAYKVVESCRPKRVLWVMLIYTFIPLAKPLVLLFVSGGDAHPVQEDAKAAAGATKAEIPVAAAAPADTEAAKEPAPAANSEEVLAQEPAEAPVAQEPVVPEEAPAQTTEEPAQVEEVTEEPEDVTEEPADAE